MKVRIIKATGPQYWYRDKIGEVFEVIDYADHNHFEVKRSCFFGGLPGGVYTGPQLEDTIFMIDKDDCEIEFEDRVKKNEKKKTRYQILKEQNSEFMSNRKI